MRGFPNKNYYALRYEILERDGFTCQYCGQHAPNVILHVDHKIPVCDGGTDDKDNLITACSACNVGKEALRASREGRKGKLLRSAGYTNGVLQPSWEELVAAEPRLQPLLDEAMSIEDEGGGWFCARVAFHQVRNGKESLRMRMTQLVGFEAGYGYVEEHDFSKDNVMVLIGAEPETPRLYEPAPILRTNLAYDRAYWTIYNALPKCRNCLCGSYD